MLHNLSATHSVV